MIHILFRIWFLQFPSERLSGYNELGVCREGWWRLVFGWVCWESSVPLATSEPNSRIQLSLKEIFGGDRGDSYTFSYMISPVSIRTAFRDTIGWECVVKDDGVRSRLIELKYFPLSKFYIDPVNRVLMSSPLFLLVPCKTWYFQVDVHSGCLCSLSIGFTGRKNTVCRLLKFLTSWYQCWIWWWNVNWSHIQRDKCTWRNRPESRHCPVDEGSMRLRPQCPWRARR